MSDDLGGQALKAFFEQYDGLGLFSTSAKVVYFVDPLYNVSGSTRDPKIGGQAWKQLLIDNGINGDCYATTPQPGEGTSHSQFNVGGHMTPNEDGSVRVGGVCYLMPLCYWHNSPGRNGEAFEHTATKMLKLFGYKEGEPAATFLARMPGAPDFRLVTAEGNTLTVTPSAEPPLVPLAHAADGHPSVPSYHLLFHKVLRDGVEQYVIDSANLP
jgi:hypothetical protein